MARIKPGSLSGAAVPLWTQMDIRMPRTSRRKRKDRIQPQEILAWFNLAQTVAKDESILGGIVNAIARKSRESELAEKREIDAAESKQQALNALDLRQQRQLRDPLIGQQAAQIMTGATPTAFSDLAEQGQQAMPPQTVTPEMLQQVAAAQSPQQQLTVAQPQAQPQQVSTPASRPGELAAQAGQAGQLPTFQDALRMQQEADLEAEKARTADFAKIKAYTFQDLMAMAAGAQNGEQLRHVMAMVPQVMEQDPSFAPRSLSDLLFGGGGQSSGDLSKTLIQAYLQRQGKARSRSQQEADTARAARLWQQAQTGQARAPAQIEYDTARAAKAWGSLDLQKARADAARARAEKARAERDRISRVRRKTGRGSLGTKQDDALVEYGVFLGELKAVGGNTNALMAKDKIGLVPERFLIKDAQGNTTGVMNLDSAHGRALKDAGKRGKTQVKDQRKFYQEGIKPPKASGQAAADRRVRDARKDVEDALRRHRAKASVAGGDPKKQVYGKQDIQDAERLLPGLKTALERAVARAAGEGLIYEIVEMAYGQLDVKLKSTQATPAEDVPRLKGRVIKKGE